MTSGTFSTFPLSSIWVDRSKRQRRELPQIEELAESISRLGLIHPPVIRRSGELVVGERRWTAMKSLGWTDCPVQFIEDLPEDELRAVELEENVKRVDLTWQDKCLAVHEFHQLKAAQNSDWEQTKTGEALGFHQSAISQFLSVAKELIAGNETVASAPKLSTAKNIVARKNERAQAAAIAQVAGEAPKPQAPLLNADFTEWRASYSGPKFNLIHCDFPYGVGMHRSDQGAGKEFGSYADSEDVYWDLLEVLRLAMENVVHESAHLIFWFSMDYYQKTFDTLSSMGWKVSPFPLVWVKDDNTGILPDANRGPRRIYETAFFASRGDRHVVKAVSNAFSYPGREKSIHMNEKPIPMLTHFLRMVTDEYSVFLDPTAGSANAVRAAKSLGAQQVLGIERDPEFFRLASEAFFGESKPLDSIEV